MKKIIEKIRQDKLNVLHIAIIIIGIIFVSIPIFHKHLWFDESYTVGIVSKSFIDIWKIGSNDVHPVLYSWILHLFSLIFDSNIYVYRILSMLPIAILGILGYTHIKKDFGKKVGVLFSFFVFFLPINSVYSGEVRMYTWAMLFVTAMAIYAFRIYKQIKQGDGPKVKNWIIFAIFSLASAYTHYYGLATAGVVNALLFVYILIKTIKTHNKKELIKFSISAVTQVLLYLPWLWALLSQVKGVSKGFWIQKPTIDLWLQIFRFQFSGNLDVDFISNNIATVLGLSIIIYTIISLIKMIKKESIKPGIFAISIYAIVTLAIFAISLKVPILYARYFLNLTGLFIFFISFFIGKGGWKYLNIAICAITLIVAIMVNVNVTKMNYAKNNYEPLNFIKQNLQENDLILFGNEGSGFVISMQLINNPNCFYDKNYWNVEPAYKAFGEDMLTIKTLDAMDNYVGRIWIINSDHYSIYDEFKQRYGEDVELIRQEKFYTDYHWYTYSATLIKKQ